MASIDRYRPPPREGYQPPTVNPNGTASKSPSKKRDVPPAVPSPPTMSSRNSPPRPLSHRTAPSPSNSTPKSPSMPRDQWFFTEDEVLSSPSVLEGISPAEERLRRAKGVNFIYQAGVLLELPQTTLYVAGIFFHRFFMRQHMVVERGGVHHYNIAATALFLANKTEENCRKTKDVIINVAKVAQKNLRLIVDEQSKEYWRWRDSIMLNEEVMLEALTFDLMTTNPHTELYDILKMELRVIHNKSLRHAAWAFCNDSCYTYVPLLMPARDIAIASIFFSSTYTGERIADMDGKPWWKAIGANEDFCLKAIMVLKEFYTENPLRKPENPYSGSPEFVLESTRHRADDSSNDVTPRTERNTQSPKAMTGRDAGVSASVDDRSESAAVESASKTAPGDSDAALKEAANHPEIHENTSADGLGSARPKRKEVESLVGEMPDAKRPRTDSEDDEGEVRE